ncbi:class A beta-lactamase-related serine hydrolase [Corynebacterium hylobatis]|uniref:Class A beta-lactamase-related serine hydrolase n=1 Tax=Corynebacterium hylobatis TaxID=1859290 RepID=A0A430I2L1_9CORY|nr:serine hydrolase domain-containing protein [Corynebacterium hylobatis]RSZ66133.1 class A beta-lactamase-related serine hydrolase [Corynebacterium hylobatis]
MQPEVGPRRLPRRQVLIVVAAIAVLALVIAALALVAGPRQVAVATERTGDPGLATRLTELAEPGHHRLSTFLIEDGRVTYAGLGMDEHSEVEIGSLTKTFTAEILANQIEAGRVSAGTTVGEIIDAGDAPVGDVTLAELADHTSGLPRLGGTNWLGGVLSGFTGANPYAGISRQDVIDAALAAELSGRGEWEYSNLGPALLGQLLAIEAGTTYEQLLSGQILEPLGMTETYLMTPGSVPADAPRGLYSGEKEAEPWEMEGYLPAGGLRSTAADMARYATHLLDHGLPGHAWMEQEDGMIEHTGGTYGFSSILVLDPASGRAVFTAGDTGTRVGDLSRALL